MSDVLTLGHGLPPEVVEQMRAEHPELFDVQSVEPTEQVTGPSHALQMGGSLSDMKTKCGRSINEPELRCHGVAFNPAAADCIPCAAVVAAELELERYRRGPVHPALERYYEWALGPDSGISSKTIVQAITGAYVLDPHRASVPRDPADFGRCSRLLAKFPELRTKLSLVSDEHPEWTALVAHWDELEGLFAVAERRGTGMAPELYARMRELEGTT